MKSFNYELWSSLVAVLLLVALGCERSRAQGSGDNDREVGINEAVSAPWLEVFRWPSTPLDFLHESQRLMELGARSAAIRLLELYVEHIGAAGAIVLELCRYYQVDRRFEDILDLVNGVELDGWGELGVVQAHAEATFYTGAFDEAEAGYVRLVELSGLVPEGIEEIIVFGFCRVYIARGELERCRELLDVNAEAFGAMTVTPLVELIEYILEYLDGSVTTTHFLLSAAMGERIQAMKDSLGIGVLLSGGHYDVAEERIGALRVGSVRGERNALLSFLALGRGELMRAETEVFAAVEANPLFGNAELAGATLFWRPTWRTAWSVMLDGRFEEAETILMGDTLSIEVGWIPMPTEVGNLPR